MTMRLMTSKEWGALTKEERKRLLSQGYDIVKGGYGPWRPESDEKGKSRILDDGDMIETSEVVVAKAKNKGIVLKEKKIPGSIPDFHFPVMEKTKREVVISRGTQGRITAKSQYAGELHIQGQPPLHVVRKHFDVVRHEWRARKAFYGPKKPRLSR